MLAGRAPSRLNDQERVRSPRHSISGAALRKLGPHRGSRLACRLHTFAERQAGLIPSKGAEQHFRT